MVQQVNQYPLGVSKTVDLSRVLTFKAIQEWRKRLAGKTADK